MRLGILRSIAGCMLAVATLGLMGPSAAWAQSPELLKKEINLLKRRNEQIQARLDEELVARLVYQTQLEVSVARGLESRELVDFAPLTREVLEAALLDSVEKQFPERELQHYVWFHELFGALPEGTDFVEMIKALLDEQVGGLYDPITHMLYVRPDFGLETQLGRTILAHEICHALQDQHFDLMSMGLFESGNSDASAALQAVIEGDATVLMSEHMAHYGSPIGLLGSLPQVLTMDQSALQNAPTVLSESMMFPYLQGMSFLMELAGRTRQRPSGHDDWQENGSWRDEVFIEYPESTEQVIHPEKYLARELPILMPSFTPLRMKADYSTEDTLGELGIRLIMADQIGQPRAIEAAAGWGGDRFVVLEDEAITSRTAVWRTQWDTPGDAEEFRKAMQDALAKRYEGEGLSWSDDGEGTWRAEVEDGELRVERLDEVRVNLTVSFALPGDPTKAETSMAPMDPSTMSPLMRRARGLQMEMEQMGTER